MKRFSVLALFVFVCACGLHAQAVDTTVCAIVKNPKSFDGKIVRIKGTVVAGFDDFIVKDTSGPCGFPVDGIWLSYPAGTKGKAGPASYLQLQPAHNFAGTYTAPTRTPVTLTKDKSFKDFDNALSEAHSKGQILCLGCVKNSVTATLVGRLDGVESATLQRDKAGKIIGFGGFGNMNAYPARLVLQSVADVTPKEVDYKKSDVLADKDDPNFAPRPAAGGFFDPIQAAQRTLGGLAGSPAGVQGGKDVAVFGSGKTSEKNGVNILYVSTIDAGPNNEELGAKDSPDGILYNWVVNENRLDGFPMARAVIHMGQHISDLRNPIAGNEDAPPYVLEYNAWSMAVAVAAFSGQQYFVLPGGYVAWNARWPAGDRNASLDGAIKSFLSDEAALGK
jgi:hypothetical protein